MQHADVCTLWVVTGMQLKWITVPKREDTQVSIHISKKHPTLKSKYTDSNISLTQLILHSLCFLLFQAVEMDPTDNQDELMHELIRGSTGHIAPEFDEDENDGSQFLNLHYHGDEEQDISGEEEENVEEAEV